MPLICCLRSPIGTLLPLLLIAGVFTLTACQRKTAPEEQPSPPAQSAALVARPATDWTKFRDEYLEAYFKAHPTVAVSAGRHEFDGRLPDWSKAGIASEISCLHTERERAGAFDEASLSASDRFEREYLLARIDRDLFWLETAQAPFRNPVFYLDLIDGLDPAVYLTRPYAPIEQRMRAFIEYAKAIPKAAEQIEANLSMPMAKPLLERGIAAFGGFADFYRDDVPKAFTMIRDPALLKEFELANAQAATAMRKLAGWMEINRNKGNPSFALGKDKYARMLLATEKVDVSIAELEQRGQADLERNLSALREACAKFLPGKPLPDCLAKMNANKPQDGAVKGARAQLDGLRDTLQTAAVVSVPGEERALVNEAPPYNRSNSAYIDIPGPYEKGLPSVYYIAPPDPSWSEKEQRDYLPGQADLLFTSVHEVWPGHFLQFLHSNRSESIVGRLFVGYAFAEGWAHYAEEMMWEIGLNRDDPETHIGQLSNALLRNVRFLSSIGMHTGGMTLEQAEKMFREKAFADAGTARQQAVRGAYDPGYLNYTMGKLMIRKLREDWCATRGGRAAWREFHDKLLSYGGPPVPMVRRAMMGSGDSGALF